MSQHFERNSEKKNKKSKILNLDVLRQEIVIDDHQLTIERIAERYNTDLENGLSSERAQMILEKEGRNELTPPRDKNWWLILLKHLFQGFSIMLWVGAGLCLIAFFIQNAALNDCPRDNLWLSIVLMLICVVTGIFSYFQEAKSFRIMESFKSMIPQYALVIRDGSSQTIPSFNLVRGDLVELKAGDRIPADIRLIETRHFKVDNSSLTGESDGQVREAHISEAQNCLEAINLAFFSTYAIEGTAKGIVILCGDHTVIGRIAGLASRLEPKETPIAIEIGRFMHLISTWAIFLGVTFGLLALYIGYEWLEAAIFLIGIIVANVPEGLLATVTVCLSLTAKRMASKNCLIKHLEAVETLGSTSCICSDKTGTLTQNRMTVAHIGFNHTRIRINYAIKSIGIDNRYVVNPIFLTLIRAGCLCNRAKFENGQMKIHPMKRKISGDASEAAILKFCEMVTGDVVSIQERNKKVAEIPFNSTNKYQVSIHRLSTSRHLLVMKGAPERILDRCSRTLHINDMIPLTPPIRKRIENSIEKLGSYGERVIGFCELSLDRKKYPIGFEFEIEPPNFPLEGLCFIGLMSLLDPPRPGVPDAVRKCRDAGIRIIMVTGDHPITAKAIAEKVGIISETSDIISNITTRLSDPGGLEKLASMQDTSAVVVHGLDLRLMSQNILEYILRRYKEIVFARTSPTQKLYIVEACQRLGAIVAVTGDGVNDSPALKRADIGIAMGITGSDVSKQSADMILMDDNFASIVTGIEEGRLVFDNLKKSVAYTIASNVPEILPFLIFIIIGIPLPIGVIAVLCIDLGTDMWPAISLAYEKAESDIMSRRPRHPKIDRLVTGKLLFVAYGQIGVIEAAAGFFTYFVIMTESGWMPSDLINLRQKWNSKYINDLEDSYGQEWTYSRRKVLEYTCHTAFFISVVVTQWTNVIISKTRYNSIIHQGMDNWVLNFGLVFETLVAYLIVYVPAMNEMLKTQPVRAKWWLPAVPFAICILVYDEGRRWWLRNNPGGWLERTSYY